MRKKLILVIVSCIILTGCGDGGNDSKKETANNTDPVESSTLEFNLEEYKNLVSEFNKKLLDESVLLSNMGNYEQNYWKSLNRLGGKNEIDYDGMVEKAYDWMLKKGNIEQVTVTNNYSDICTMYKEIAAIDVQGNEAVELGDNVKQLYSSFDALYLLVTEPSGDISTFSDNFNKYSDSIKNINSTISTLLGEK